MTNAQKKLNAISVKIESHPAYTQRRSRVASALEKIMYRHRHKLIYVHVVMFIFFMALIVIPLFLPLPRIGATPLNNFTEFSLFAIWGIWFPLVFLSVIISGRSWCGLFCPLGAASQWTNKIGLKRAIPAWLRWEGTPVLSFIIVTILAQTMDARDQAKGLAEIFLLTLGLALLIGFLFGKGGNKRAWCRHVCPIGLLLGVFSRLGIVQFSPKQQYPKGSTYANQGACPTFININHKNESRHCIECFHCVKPSSKGGLFVHFRKPGKEIEDIHRHNGNLTEVFFIFMGTGVSLGGFLWLILPSYQTIRQAVGNWFIEHNAYWIANIGPHWLMSVTAGQAYNWLDFMMIVGFMLFYLMAVTGTLSICTTINAWLITRLGGTGTFKHRFVSVGYSFAPIAMLSIIIGLGDILFKALGYGLGDIAIIGIKLGALLISMAWSTYLGLKAISLYHLSGYRRWLAFMPMLLGILVIALAWWPAIFGSNFSALEYYRHHLISS